MKRSILIVFCSLCISVSFASNSFASNSFAETSQTSGAPGETLPALTQPADSSGKLSNVGAAGLDQTTVIAEPEAITIQKLIERVVRVMSEKTQPAPAALPEKIASVPTPLLVPEQIEQITAHVPASYPEKKRLEDQLSKVASAVEQEQPGAQEEAVSLIQQLKEYTFDPLVISGARLPTTKNRLSNIPANVSVITEEELDAQGPKTVQEAMGLLEGVVMYDQIGNGFEQSFGLRGFETGTEVAVIVDGVRYNEPDGGVVNYSLINIDDVEQIEVARGSYSGVYGNSAFGGVVNITTRTPDERKFVPFGTFENGTNKRFYQHAGASGTISDLVTGMDGKMKYYVSMGRKLNDEFRSNSEIRTTSLLAKWGYVWPDEVVDTQFQLSYADNAMSNPGELTVEEFHHTPEITSKPLDGRKFENLVLQWDAKVRLHEKVSARVNAYRRVEDVDFTTTSIQFGISHKELTQFLTTKGLTTALRYEENFDFLGIDFLNNTLELGVEYRNENENDRGRFVNLDGSLGADRGDQGIDLDTGGVFIQNTSEWFDRLVTTVGLRHDEVDYRYDDSAFPNVDPVSDFDNTSMQVGTVFKLTRYADLYANFSEGFKSPSISELFSTDFLGGGNSALVPEESNSYEVGFRLREFGNFSGNLSFFYIDLKNEILFDPDAGPISIFGSPEGRNVNVGTSRRMGIEYSLKYKPRDWFETFLTYTYTQATLRSTQPFPTDPTTSLFTEAGAFQSGTDIGLVPHNRFTLGFTLSPLRNLRLHLNGIYTGAQRTQGYEALGSQPAIIGAPVAARGVDSMMDGYFLVNGRVSYSWKDAELFLQVSNLLNTDYVSRAVTATIFVPTAENMTFVTPGQPREISFGTRIKFG